MKNPSPYGGIQTLEWIKEIKDDGLTERDLGYCNITDLTPLEDLVSLEILDLSSNQISDLSPLEGLTDLRELGLGWNYITDLSPLVGLAKLNLLDLRYNNISESQKVIIEAVLPNTNIIW